MRPKYFIVLAIIVMVGAAMVAFAQPPEATGAITGKVTYTGTPMRMRPIDMSKDPYCVKQHPTPIDTQSVVTGPGHTLKWVVVFISAGDLGTGVPSQSARFDQRGCEYIPHVLPMEADQQLMIYNDDQTLHNIHPMPKTNREWNRAQPPNAPPIDTKWAQPEFIPVKCNIHPWMHGYFVVLKTPHYAVTGDDGTFEIKGLRPGKYTVTAWQEQYGTKTQQVTITGTETKTADFVFTALPY